MLIIRKVMVRHAPIAAKLCLQNGIELVGICCGRNSDSDRSINNSKLAELVSSNTKPGGEFEV